MSSEPKMVTTTQNQNKEPWANAQPALNTALTGAQGLYNSGTGYVPYSGKTSADFTGDQVNAMQGMRDIAGQGDPLTANAYGALNQNISNGGLNGGLTGVAQGYGQLLGRTVGGQDTAAQVAAGGQTNADMYLRQMASGQEAMNPYLQTMLGDMEGRINNQVASKMSGAGRYGSFGHGDALARSVTAASAPVLAQAYEASKGRQLSATGQLDAARNAMTGQQLAGASLLGQLNNMDTQNAGNALGKMQGLYEKGMDRVDANAAMAPQLYQSLFAPHQMQFGIGQLEQGQDQQGINDAINYYNASQARPWEQLSRLNAVASGAGGLGGTMVGSGTQPSTAPSMWQQLLGGGIAGAGLLSKMKGF